MDGKEPKHGGGQSVLTAVSVPSQHYLGSAMVDTKTNEIPVAQELFPAWNWRAGSSRWMRCIRKCKPRAILVLEDGGDYLLTVKDNQPTLRQNIEKILPARKADFPPWRRHDTALRTTCFTRRRTGRPTS